MSYVVGLANNMLDLKNALEQALQLSGYTGVGILSKGSVHVSYTIQGNGTSIGSYLVQNVGTSISGGVLENFVQSRIGVIPVDGSSAGLNQTSWEWPIQYHIHTFNDPDEAYLLVNYGPYWQSLAVGCSPAPGNPGTGNWCHGSQGINAICYDNTLAISPDGVASQYYYAANMGCNIPFALRSVGGGSSAQSGSRIHSYTGASGVIGWSPPLMIMSQGGVGSMVPLQPLLRTQPNSWNGEAALLPCQLFQGRLESKVSLVGELANLRILRNDFLPDGDVVEVGLDRWKVYPAYRRNTSARDGVPGEQPSNHSGTMAVAIRYDGP